MKYDFYKRFFFLKGVGNIECHLVLLLSFVVGNMIGKSIFLKKNISEDQKSNYQLICKLLMHKSHQCLIMVAKEDEK